MKNIKRIMYLLPLIAMISAGTYYYFKDDSKPVVSPTASSTQTSPVVQLNNPVKSEELPNSANLTAIMLKASKSNSIIIGPKNAKVSVVEFLDPENMTTAKIHNYIKNEIRYYGNNVRWTFRYLPSAPNSKLAIKILEAARNQNMYLEVMEVLFTDIEKWISSSDDPKEVKAKEKELMKIIEKIPNLKISQLKQDMKNKEIEKILQADKSEGAALGVKVVPTLFVNNKMISPLSLDEMIKLIDLGLK